jgi:hypothetical protein
MATICATFFEGKESLNSNHVDYLFLSCLLVIIRITNKYSLHLLDQLDI